jgi:hypothetical protein
MPLLAAFTLTTPMMLWGAALALLPLVAHLLNRHARRRVIFPSIRLLAASAATQSRLFKMRRWILLLLRCAFVALIAAAFARPLWFASREAQAASGQHAGVVLIVDVSASTGQETDGVRLIEQLRASAGRVLDSLQPGQDVAAVITTGDRTESAFPRLSPNLPALRDHLRKLTAQHGRAEFSKSLALAGEILASHGGPRRVVIVSDLQRTNWQDGGPSERLAQLLPPGTQVSVLDPGVAPPDNVALSAPRVAPPRPVVGQTSQCIVRVANTSPRDKQALVEMRIEKGSPATQTVSLAPGEECEIAFAADWTDLGERTVSFALPADGLADDNRAFLVVRPAQRLPVLLLTDDDPNEPGTGAYFLSRALSPTSGPDDRYDVRRIPPARATASDIAAAEVVFLEYVSGLSPALAGELLKHMRTGGSLVCFAGDPLMAPALAELQRTAAAGPGGILPFALGPLRDLTNDRDPLTISGGQWRSRLLRDFDEQSQLALAQIRFHRVFSSRSIPADAEVLLTFSDGSPALARRPLGEGQLLVANFSADVSSSDFGKFGSFVALMQVLARELRPQAGRQGTGTVGQSWTSPDPLPAGVRIDTVRLVDPADEPLALVFDAAAPNQSLRIDHPELPGLYRFHAGQKLIAAAAIHIDPRESRLERIDAKDLARQLNTGPVKAGTATTAGWEPTLSLRGQPVWHWLVAAACALLALELACVSWWRR